MKISITKTMIWTILLAVLSCFTFTTQTQAQITQAQSGAIGDPVFCPTVLVSCEKSTLILEFAVAADGLTFAAVYPSFLSGSFTYLGGTGIQLFYQDTNGSCAGLTLQDIINDTNCTEAVNCPGLSLAVAPPAVIISESTCTIPGGTPSGGVIAPPIGSCPMGSTLEYNLDGAGWSTTLPAYNQTTSVTVETRCTCDSDNMISSAVSSVTTMPGDCPTAVTCPTSAVCNAGQLVLTFATSADVTAFQLDNPTLFNGSYSFQGANSTQIFYFDFNNTCASLSLPQDLIGDTGCVEPVSDPCDSNDPAFVDTDGDMIGNACDLDDDNDGILDTDECPTFSFTPISSGAGTFTDSGMPGDVGDMTLYSNYGTYNGMAFDMKLTVTANSNPTSLGANISGVSSTGFFWPIFLENSGNSGQSATIRFEFFQTGTSTPMSIPASFLWKDIDDTNPGEQIDIQSADLASYQMAQPTSLVATNNGSIIEFTSTANGTPTSQNLWLQTSFLSNSSIDITFYKRDFDTGYIWDAGAFGTPGPVVPVNPIVCTTDTDGDGTPNSLDTDSDGDGCPDALEGAGGFADTDIDANDMLTGGVDADGVPTSAGGGQADVSSTDDTVQAAACATDPCDSNSPTFVDTDGDMIGDVCDLDDDNDGVLDTDECLIGLMGAGGTLPNGTTYTVTAPGLIDNGNGDIAFGTQGANDILIIVFSNPTDLTISGQSSSGSWVWETSGVLLGGQVITDGSNWIYTPGAVNAQLDLTSGQTAVATLPPGGSVLASSDWGSLQSFGVTQIALRAAALEGYVFSVCELDTDGDGITNNLDTDSDGDGCPDVLEGAGSFADTDIDANDMLTGGVDANGVPTAANGGQSVGASQDDTDDSACVTCNASSGAWSN